MCSTADLIIIKTDAIEKLVSRLTKMLVLVYRLILVKYSVALQWSVAKWHKVTFPARKNLDARVLGLRSRIHFWR